MSFSARPERPKIPSVAKKSPGRETSGTPTRKCSSPVFTSSPSRPSVKAPLKSLLKTPEHYHHKENGHPGAGATQRPHAKLSAAQPGKPPVTSSPRKVFGDHNEPVLRPRRLRKEWQIPSPSALELKESLSGTSDAGAVVVKSGSFTINSAMLSEPQPVAGWIQTREETVISEPKRVLFEANSPALSEHSYAGSSTVETTQDDEHTSELREVSVSLPAESFSVEKSLSVVTELLVEEESPAVPEVHVEQRESSPESKSCVGQEKLSVTTEFAEMITLEEEEPPKARRSFFKLNRWSFMLGLLVLLSCSLFALGPEKLLTAPSFLERLDWSSDGNTVGFYVDPGRLRTDALTAKVYLDGVYEKGSRIVLEKVSTYRRHAEDLGLRSVELAGSYYSSLVLQNHAKDVLYNYCDKFQGQYHQLRLALVSFTEQMRPLVANARALFTRLSFDESMSKVRDWIHSAEHFVYERLVLDYFHVPAEDREPSTVEQPDVSAIVTDEVESLAELDVASIEPAFQGGVLQQSTEVCDSNFQEEAQVDVAPAENEDGLMIQEDETPVDVAPTENEDRLVIQEDEAPVDNIAPTENEDVLMIKEDEAPVDNVPPTENEDVLMIQEDEAPVDNVPPTDMIQEDVLTDTVSTPEAVPAQTVEAVEDSTEAPEPVLEEDTITAAQSLVSHAKLYAAAAVTALVLLVAGGSYQIFYAASKPVASAPSEPTSKHADGVTVTEVVPPSPFTPKRVQLREELVMSPDQPTAESPYGSFTAYKRTVVNGGSESEQVKLTPVRRSSRIRNQAYQSPRLK